MLVAERVRDTRAIYSTAPKETVCYEPRGAARKLFLDKSDEIILDGPAGTGKTRAILEKAHLLANKYPESRGLIVRRTRASLTQTALVTFENHVLGRELGRRVKFNSIRQEYRYPNRSIIAVGGLDKDIKVMSSEYDFIVVIEATEVPESIWDALTTRLRNGKIPYQQIFGDCNPDAPGHWIKKRKTLNLYPSRHEDNPVLFDPVTGELTEKGKAYMTKLDNLTGVRHQRLRLGLWVQAEGAIYTDWDREAHLVDQFEPPKSWPRYWSIDFGFTNPFVWQEWAQDPDGELYLYREIYHTGRLVEDHARHIAEITKDSPRPTDVICDHDAEGRATLERHLNISTRPAFKSVSPGIQAVQSRLKKKGNGRRGIWIMRDALIEKDPDLEDAKKPLCTEEEVEGYVWDLKQGKRRGEEPVKANDHGLDAARYLVAHVDDLRSVRATAENAEFSILDL